MLLWKGPNGPKTLLTCKIHNYKSCWSTLRPPRYSRGLQKVPFSPIPQISWPKFGAKKNRRNIGMWGVQSVATEYPAQIILLRTIWSHPAGENSQKHHFGSFSLKIRPFCGDFWANWHPKQFHIVYLGDTYPYHTLVPLNGPLLHSRAPKRARCSPQRPFWGPQRSSEGPRGPDLFPSAADWSEWAGIMVIRHYDLVSCLFWAPTASKEARFGPKMALLGALKGPKLKIFANLWCDLSKCA